MLTPDDILYVAKHRCSCGAGLARVLDLPADEVGSWQCSVILLGGGGDHVEPRPFLRYPYRTELHPGSPTTRPGGLTEEARYWLTLRVDGTEVRDRVIDAVDWSAHEIDRVEISLESFQALAALYGSPRAARQDLGVHIIPNRELDYTETLVVANLHEVEPIAG